MCFSFEVSIGSFLFSWGISLYLLNKGLNKRQRQNVIFLMIFSTIQLADAILWYNKMKKDNINYIVTSYIIPLILSSQILYNVFEKNNNKNQFITILTFSSILYIFYRFNGYSRSLCNNKFSSPVWGSKELSFMELVVFALMVTYPNYNLFIFSLILLLATKIFVGGAYGSLWCAIANILSLYYLSNY